jgi:hypothetical protein
VKPSTKLAGYGTAPAAVRIDKCGSVEDLAAGMVGDNEYIEKFGVGTS